MTARLDPDDTPHRPSKRRNASARLPDDDVLTQPRRTAGREMTGILEKLGACREAVVFVSSRRTAHDAWEVCPDGRWLAWIVSRCHPRGTMTKRRLVQVALKCIAPIAHLLPETSIDDLGIVAQWTIGAATIDEVRAARRRLWRHYAAVAVTGAAAAAAVADVIRSVVTIDEVCAALGVNPDALICAEKVA